jgi:hypothetical protein
MGASSTNCLFARASTRVRLVSSRQRLLELNDGVPIIGVRMAFLLASGALDANQLFYAMRVFCDRYGTGEEFADECGKACSLSSLVAQRLTTRT